MKQLKDFDPAAIRRLIEREGWHQPLPEVRPVALTPGQRALFWGLRAYVLIMSAVVVWAFVHGAQG